MVYIDDGSSSRNEKKKNKKKVKATVTVRIEKEVDAIVREHALKHNKRLTFVYTMLLDRVLRQIEIDPNLLANIIISPSSVLTDQEEKKENEKKKKEYTYINIPLEHAERLKTIADKYDIKLNMLYKKILIYALLRQFYY
ncbi:MAG: hypothetical protein QXM92_00555 [Candidatus Anstonellales archaeon]